MRRGSYALGLAVLLVLAAASASTGAREESGGQVSWTIKATKGDVSATGSGAVTIPGGLPDLTGETRYTIPGTASGSVLIRGPGQGTQMSLQVSGPATYFAKFGKPTNPSDQASLLY